MDITVQRLLDDLGTISKVGINDKLGTSCDSLDIQREGIRQSLKRTLYGDKRSKSISYIVNTVNTTIAILSLLMESIHLKDKNDTKYRVRYQTLYSLLSSLSRSKQGIENLQITYHSDGLLLIELKDLISKIETFVDTCCKTVGISPDEI